MIESNLHIKLYYNIILTFFLIGMFSVIGTQAQNIEVVAEKGDGIYRLLTRNGLSAAEYMDTFIQMNKERLGKENSLYAGRKYRLPGKTEEIAVSSGTRMVRHEIFGKEFENVNLIDDKLKGAVYYLVAGHGGPDPGAVGRYNNWQLCEDEYAYDVTLRLARNLIQHGALVYMITRDPNDGIRNDSYLKADKDEICYPDSRIPINQLRRLKQRTEAVNQIYSNHRGSFQRMIALHVDSRSHGENIDVFFYHDRQSKTGRKAAITLKNKFQQKYDLHQPGRGYSGTVSDRNLYVVRNSYPVAVYIELGNINHRRDQQRFIISSNRQALANWLFEGMVDDFKENK